MAATYLMQARSSSNGQLYSWQAASADWAAAGYPGPGSAQDVAVAAFIPDGTLSGIPDGSVTTAKINDGAVTTPKLADGSVTDVKVNASAAIAGTKITPNFGSQNIATTGVLSLGATPATSGSLRVTDGFTLSAKISGTDRPFVSIVANDATFGHANGNVTLEANAGIVCRVANAERVFIAPASVLFRVASLLWNDTVTAPTLTQQATNTTCQPLAIRAQGSVASGAGIAGGDLRLQGGRKGASSGESGAVLLSLNDDDANFYRLVQVVEIERGRRITALNRSAKVTTTEMPTSTGDLVTYLGNCGTAPSANPVGGGILYVTAGALTYRGSGGTVTTVAPA